MPDGLLNGKFRHFFIIIDFCLTEILDEPLSAVFPLFLRGQIEVSSFVDLSYVVNCLLN